MTKPIKFILSLCLLAIVFIFGPFVWNNLVAKISNQTDVSKVIFSGSPVACEYFKTKMTDGNEQFKKSIFDQLINVLSISQTDYLKLSQSQSSSDKSLNSPPDDSYLAEGGHLYGQRCLFDLLVYYPADLEKIITLLFKSPFADSKLNLQNQFALQGFIEKQCRNNAACVTPLKQQMKTQDTDFIQKYGPLLAQLGEAGAQALFDVFLDLPDASLGDLTPETPPRKKGQALLASIAYAPVATLEIIKPRIQKKLSDPQFSSIKKQMITSNYQLKINYLSATADPMIQKMLDQGKQIKSKYQAQIPAGTEDLTNWLISIDRFNGDDFSDQEKTELTSLLEFFVKWVCDNLGLNSALIKHIVLTTTFTDKIKLPMKLAQDLLIQPKFAPIGLKLLLLEIPINPASETSFYTSFSQLDFRDKEDVFRFADETVNKKRPQSIPVIFNLGLYMSYNEYRSLMPISGPKKDDLLLEWKSFRARIKRELNEDELIRYYEVSKDSDILKSLKKIWSQSQLCTQNRLDNLTGIAGQSESIKTIDQIILDHLSCAQDKSLKKSVVNLMMILRSSENRSEYTAMIEKNPKLSSDLKSEFLKMVNAESIDEISDF